jgi:hypothetical protein
MIVLVLSCMLVSVPASARTESSGAAHVAFEVPDTWVTTTQGNDVVIRAPTNNVLVNVTYVTSADEVRRQMSQLDQFLGRLFRNVQMDPATRQVTQAGLQGVARNGSAVQTSNGQSVRFFVMVLGHQGGGAIVVGIVSTSSTQTDMAALMSVLNSLRRA